MAVRNHWSVDSNKANMPHYEQQSLYVIHGIRGQLAAKIPGVRGGVGMCNGNREALTDLLSHTN
jgi:hypothetical protein